MLRGGHGGGAAPAVPPRDAAAAPPTATQGTGATQHRQEQQRDQPQPQPQQRMQPLQRPPQQRVPQQHEMIEQQRSTLPDAVSGNSGVVVDKNRSTDLSGRWLGINTGCFAVRGGRLLVVQQRSGMWSLPGGTGEHGETPQRTAERETYEETGYRVSARGLLTTWNGFRIYRCSVHGNSGGSKDHHEVLGYGWKSAREIRRMRWRFPRQARHYPVWMR
mmetsp:Transcript_68785/g.212749  ORF Transcript_68785/g.212749 Transcript_68785/m.212749 type:complete len:218 (+) Transcript_68785:3-656(+)